MELLNHAAGNFESKVQEETCHLAATSTTSKNKMSDRRDELRFAELKRVEVSGLPAYKVW